MSAQSEQLADALRVSLKETERLRQQLQRLRATASEPVAIVGMSCRFPAGVSCPEDLWELVASGGDAISGFPDDRGWDVEALYDPDPDRDGTTYVREGGFIPSGEFDAGFFGFGPTEALEVDPQERLFLEASWTSLEAAGLDPQRLAGSPVGVFAGVMHHDYNALSGMSSATVSGRVSYALGFEGPSLVVDTACSSSLVTLHLAAASLRAGECSLALAGGATVMSTPAVFTEFSRQRGLAPDGRCKPFANAADGSAFSEGAGVLVLERLSDAQANGHPVHALIVGSAVNQDGASNGITAPNGPAQERVIRDALASAGLVAAEVDAVEAHGTGTTLGDPIEAQALLATYGQDRETPLKLGSIKSNLGHAQAAAGVAGVIKMTMALREGVLPKTLHVDSPSEQVEWEAGKVELLTETEPWQAGDRPRRAGVSSFGASGTNAHLILEEAPGLSVEAKAERHLAPPGTLPLAGGIPLAFSARSEPALREAAGQLAEFLAADPAPEPLDLAHSLLATRSAHPERAVAVGRDREQLLVALRGFAADGEAPSVVRGTARSEQRPVFLFPGYGAQWPGMAESLITASPAFAEAVRDCAAAFEPHLSCSLDEVLRGVDGAPPADEPMLGPPILFTSMVSLAALWRSLGVTPAAVVGHSLGELVAACVAGGLSLEDAAQIVSARTEMLARLAFKGGMASVGLGADELASRLQRWQGRIDIAAVNGPAAAVVSGDVDALDELLAELESEEVRARKIRGAVVASHSHHIEEIRDDFVAAIGSISPRSGDLPFHSTVTGERLDTAELGPEYWYRNVRQTVQHEAAVRALLQAGHRMLIEVSPHPALAIAVRETVEASLADPGLVTVLGTLRRDEDALERFALSLAEAHAGGAAIEWDSVFAETGAEQVPLPTYPFQRKRYWSENRFGGGEVGAAGLDPVGHPLLGASVALAGEDGSRVFTGRLVTSERRWLGDQQALGVPLVPAATLLELALSGGREVGCPVVEELSLQEPLVMLERGALQVQLRIGSEQEGRREVTLHSRLEPGRGDDQSPAWACNARGMLAAEAEGADVEKPDEWPPRDAESVDVEALYDALADAGLECGPALQGCRAAWRRGEELFAEVELDEAQRVEAERFAVHPTLLEAAHHVAALRSGEEVEAPVVWRDVVQGENAAEALRVCLRRLGTDELALSATSPSSEAVSFAARVTTAPLPRAALQAARTVSSQALCRIAWVPPTAEPGGQSPDVELLECATLATDPGDATTSVLVRLQEWLGDDSTASRRLVVVTQGGVVASPDDVIRDPAQAALWGLLRSAQAEYPARLAIVDSDDSEASRNALPGALGLLASEPQLALREGKTLVPRVQRASAAELGVAEPLDPAATVLLVGAGEEAATLARHLAEERGVQHLLEVEPEREQLTRTIGSLAAEHPLGAVVHVVPTPADKMLAALTPAELTEEIGDQLATARLLDQLTAGLSSVRLIFISSTAGRFDGAGKSATATVNAFLDGLAGRRGEAGGTVVSVAASSGDDALLVGALDTALSTSEPWPILADLDRATLRARAETGSLPPILSSLIGVQARRDRESASLLSRLSAAPAEQRETIVLELIRDHAATVLGLGSAAEVEPDRAFQEMGFDSIGAVELRNRLAAASGQRLEPSLVFDYPSPASLAGYLVGAVMPDQATEAAAGNEGELERLVARLELLAESAQDDEARQRLAVRLQSLLAGLSAVGTDQPRDGGALGSLSNDEVFALIDEEFGAR